MRKIIYNNIEYTAGQFVEEFIRGSGYSSRVADIIHKWYNGEDHFALTTSGSTGKAAEHVFSREQLLISARQTIDFFHLNKDDVFFCCLPVSKVAGLMMVVRALVCEAGLILADPSSNPLVGVAGFNTISFAAFVPHQFQNIIEQSPEKLNFSDNMKAILLGGAPLNRKILFECSKLNIPVYETYGMTETLSHIAVRKLNHGEVAEGFTLLPGIEIQLDDEKCLSIRTPLNPERWLKTGDMAELLPDGSFKVLGRRDNVINSGGIKINIEEVEKKIFEAISFYFGKKDYFISFRFKKI